MGIKNEERVSEPWSNSVTIDMKDAAQDTMIALEGGSRLLLGLNGGKQSLYIFKGFSNLLN